MNKKMTTHVSLSAALQQAILLLQKNQPQQAIDLIEDIGHQSNLFAQAQHVRGIATFKLGNPILATALLSEAIRAGEREPNALLNLARAAAASNLAEPSLDVILESLQRSIPPNEQSPLTLKITEILGFTTTGSHDLKTRIFDRLIMPLLKWGLQCRNMDYALFLEIITYTRYVQSIETEAHFRQCMERIAPLMSESGRYWREKLPPLPPTQHSTPYKLGFFIANASAMAHFEVLLNTLKGYRQLDEQPFEPTVYCFGGKSEAMEQALAMIGVRLVMLNERFPKDANSMWRRLLRLRELLAEEGVHGLVWVSVVTLMPFAFAMRIAPVQIWWAMKYHSLELPDIDGYVTGGTITRYRTIDGRQWRNGVLGVDDWYDRSLEEEARSIRNIFGNFVVVATLARDEKMLDPQYLNAIVTLLRQHPNMFFLWTGQNERSEIRLALEEGGVLERTRYIGWVNTRLYAQVVDVFLDSFPFPCGFTLLQAMAAGKPVVISATPEAAETGLWAFIRPLLDGDEGTKEERAKLHALLGPQDKPLLAIARNPAQYIALAGRLLQDAALRKAAGEAARQLVRQYFSDPAVMGKTYGTHFVELLDAQFSNKPLTKQT